ncbi:hypothetical protein WR25_25645 [Diploscapter pachys]|uniref:Synembryn n=1 Tax=Diploscapter pachys TaxID=2018661 RepID=A0A2A2KL26_9BILA|nr:hypothetical protein WR25_25645 [Diploscapter pachys]
MSHLAFQPAMQKASFNLGKQVVRFHSTGGHRHSAAPKIITGIEYAEAFKKQGGGNPNWADYKCSEYLNMNKYSYYDTEMVEKLDVSELKKLLDAPSNEVAEYLRQTVSALGANNKFSDVDYFSREAFVKLIEKHSSDGNEVVVVLLETIRILARDAHQLDVLLNDNVTDFILKHSGLNEHREEDRNSIFEADKCLINTLYHSDKMRQNFLKCLPSLIDRICALSTQKLDGNFTFFHEWTESDRDELQFMDMRIAFITSAHIRKVQETWHKNSATFHMWLHIVRDSLIRPNSLRFSHEGLKILFNVLCHGASDSLDDDCLQELTLLLAVIVKDANADLELHQNAVNVMATPAFDPRPDIICPKVEVKEQNHEYWDDRDMSVLDSLLKILEKKMDETNSTGKNSDLLATYFTALCRICAACKEARRYCRLKVIPPLKDKDVEHRPEEGKTLRNKVVRVMMSPSHSKEVAAEFLFILCKRSVSRLIKYSGFGHSAGLLANSGLLGQVHLPKRSSDSEDSETEEYDAVRNKVNPVTGYIKPEGPDPMAGMTEEQKEYEAMKLMNAMNKMIDSGIIKPARMEGGKLVEASHVLELTKNIPTPKNSDSEDD